MARRVERVRPRAEREAAADVELEALSRRQAMRVLEYAQPDDPPRRVNGAGWVVICTVAIGALIYALGSIAAHLGGHQ